MAATNLGRVVPLYKGTYSAAAQYTMNDIVAYSGKVYWHTGSTPTTGTAPTDTTVWTLMVEPGALPSTTNLIAGDGSGGLADSGLDPSLIAYAGAAQTLTDGQKSQARANIGAASGERFADLEAFVSAMVIGEAEHVFENLTTAQIPEHVTDITGTYQTFDESELMLKSIKGKTVQSTSALASVKLDGIRVSGAAGSTAEPWEFEPSETQTLDGVEGVADTIEIVETGVGVYDVVKTTRFASMDLGAVPWQAATSVNDGFAITPTRVPAFNPVAYGKATVNGYISTNSADDFGRMPDKSVGITGGRFLRIRDSSCAGYTAAEFQSAMDGKMLVYEMLTPVTTTIATGLTEAQVACLTERGGSIAVVENDNTGIADPDVTVILQVKKAVENG